MEVYGDVTLREFNHVYKGERVTVFDGFHGIQEVTRQFGVKSRRKSKFVRNSVNNVPIFALYFSVCQRRCHYRAISQHVTTTIRDLPVFKGCVCLFIDLPTGHGTISAR